MGQTQVMNDPPYGELALYDSSASTLAAPRVSSMEHGGLYTEHSVLIYHFTTSIQGHGSLLEPSTEA